MRQVKTALVVLLAVGASSCATLRGESGNPNAPADVRIVTKKEYLPGRTVISPYPEPDSGLVRDAEELTVKHLSGDDVTAPQAIATALDWAATYHGVKNQYYSLRGWVAGVRAGQIITQEALDATKPAAIEAAQTPAQSVIDDRASNDTEN